MKGASECLLPTQTIYIQARNLIAEGAREIWGCSALPRGGVGKTREHLGTTQQRRQGQIGEINWRSTSPLQHIGMECVGLFATQLVIISEFGHVRPVLGCQVSPGMWGVESPCG